MRLMPFLVFVAAVCACAPQQPPARPADRAGPPDRGGGAAYLLMVEPVRFVADLPEDLRNRLCHPSPHKTVGGMAVLSDSYFEEERRCGGESRCFNLPAIGAFPARTEYLKVGAQTLPGISGEELTAMLLSSLAAMGNLRVVPAAAGMPKARAGERGPYVLRGKQTELLLLAEQSAAGFHGTAIGPLAVSHLFGGESVEDIGYARFDLRITDPRSQRVVAAFAVGASFSERRASDGFEPGAPYAEARRLGGVLAGAGRVALQEAALETHRRLQEID